MGRPPHLTRGLGALHDNRDTAVATPRLRRALVGEGAGAANSHASPPPVLPADAFHACGHEGQFVSVIPSQQLVVVRLGLTRPESAWDHETFLARVLDAFPSGMR